MTTECIMNILQHTKEAIIAFDKEGVVMFWNKGAENLFGYNSKNTLGKKLPFLTKLSFYEFESVIERAINGNHTIFKTQKLTKTGETIDLIFSTSPLYEGDIFIGVTAIVQEVNILKKATFLTSNLSSFMREPKRTFVEIRSLILFGLYQSKKTINQIASETNINWKTVEKHLTFLIGKKAVVEVFSSEYVRIFELTESGKIYVDKLKERELSKYVSEGE